MVFKIEYFWLILVAWSILSEDMSQEYDLKLVKMEHFGHF